MLHRIFRSHAMERPNTPASLTNRLILPPAHPNGGQRIGTAPSVSCIRCKSFIKFFGIRAAEVETPRGWPGVGKVLICGHEDRGENITAALLGKVLSGGGGPRFLISTRGTLPVVLCFGSTKSPLFFVQWTVRSADHRA